MFVKMLTHAHLSALFEKMKCIFSIAPVGNLVKSWECFSLRKHSPDAGSEAPDAVSERPVCRLPDSARVRHRTPGTGRKMEPPVVSVRCEGVLQPSLRMSPVSTTRSGCVRWLASGDRASLQSSLRMSPVCTGRVC